MIVTCNNKNYPKAEWFCKLLQNRLKRDLPFKFNITYHPEFKAYHSEETVNLFIPVRPAVQEEFRRVFERLLNGNWIKRSEMNFILDIDLIRFAIWMLSREEEYIHRDDPDAYDNHGRFKIEKTMAFQHGFWQKPVLDILISQLIEKIEKELDVDLLNRNHWSDGKSKAVWLTHDVDKLIGKYALPIRMMGWILFALRELSRWNKKESNKWITKCKYWLSIDHDPTYRSIKQICNEEKSNKAKSTFYFMSLKHGVSIQEGVRYPVNHPKVGKIINELKKAGCSIGLHPGSRKSMDVEYLFIQKESLEKVVGEPIHFVRNHYLKAQYPDSWFIGEKAGFRISSNVGWPDHNGFRAGTCWPYQPFDIMNNKSFNIIEVPIIYMDTISKNYQEIMHEISVLSKKVFSVYGLLNINFHSNIWDESETRYRGLAYKQILSEKD